MYKFDFQIFELFSQISGRYEFVDSLIFFFSELFGPILIILLICSVFVINGSFWKGIKTLILLFLPVIIAYALTSMMKYIIASPRPFIVLEFLPLFEKDPYHAYPSGHATIYMALAMSFWFYRKKLGLMVALASIIIGISRISAGVHWPFDILAGFAVGAGVVYIFQYLYVLFEINIHSKKQV